MKRVLLTCQSVIFCLFAQISLGMAADFGPWYSSFLGSIGAFDLSINLDHLRGSRTGDAVIDFSVNGSRAPCPKTTHPAFCTILQERAERGDRSAFATETLGVLYEGNKEAFVAFAFSDEETVYLLAIRRQGRSASLRLYHSARGVDAEVSLTSGPHLCEVAQCMGDRLINLAENEEKALGVFKTGDILRSFDPKRDLRAAAHRGARQQAKQLTNNTPKRKRFGIYESIGQYMTAVWRVQDGQDRPMGELRIYATGTPYWGGFGELDEPFRFRKRLKVVMEESHRTARFVTFGIAYAMGKSSNVAVASLKLDLPNAPDGKMRGLLTRGDGKIPIHLLRMGSYEGEIEDNLASDDGSDDGHGDEASDIVDLSFALRDVPKGRSLILRQDPSRSAKMLGELPDTATGIHVDHCIPSINSGQFERTDKAGKLKLLNTVWCQIIAPASPAIRGYIPGRYLTPSY